MAATKVLSGLLAACLALHHDSTEHMITVKWALIGPSPKPGSTMWTQPVWAHSLAQHKSLTSPQHIPASALISLLQYSMACLLQEAHPEHGLGYPEPSVLKISPRTV